MRKDLKYHHFARKLVILGFGSIGQAALPLILRHIEIKPSQIIILTRDNENLDIAKQLGIKVILQSITRENYENICNEYLTRGDFVINLSINVCSLSIMTWCQKNKVLYLDTATEPWEDSSILTHQKPILCMNYFLRESLQTTKKQHEYESTAIVTHGANPGLVSHFVKQGLIDLVKKYNKPFKIPSTQQAWAQLASDLKIKTIHISERDTQKSHLSKQEYEIVNTWSPDAFIGEITLPAELGWGSHETNWPQDAHHHEYGTKNAIYLDKPGAKTKIKTWIPTSKAMEAFLISHGEAITISDYLTLKQNQIITYRPTVNFAYLPCDDAVTSLLQYIERGDHPLETKRILNLDIIDGYDELGVLLMGNEHGAYWFGSQLSIHEARDLVPFNTATSLQVAVGVLSGMVWALTHPNSGVVEPDAVDFQFILEICAPYLGTLKGYFTDWTPSKVSNTWQFESLRLSK